jgi:hypothetical protein
MGDEDLPGEVERLRQERDRLAAEVEKQHSVKRHRVRSIAAAVLVALTILLTFVTVPSAWGRRTALDTNHYVDVMGPLAKDPAIQAFLATRITDQVMTAINVPQIVANVLPPKASILVGPMTSAVEGFVHDKVLALLQTDTFAQLWTDANRFVHEQVLAVLDGQGNTISVKDGVVLLNLLPLVNAALKSIQTAASGLVGNLPLPDISVTEPSPEAIAKLESALGITLPDDFGAIPVYNSNDLRSLQVGVRKFERLVYLLIALIVLFFALALVVSTRRRRTLLQLTVGMALATVLVRRLAIAGTDHIVKGAAAESQAAIRAVADSLIASLKSYTAWVLWIALIVLIVALVTGPYPWARSLRAGVKNIGPALTAGGERLKGVPALEWVTAHRDLAMGLVGALAVALFLFTNLSVVASLIVLIVVVAVEVFVWQASRPPADEAVGPGATPATPEA